MPGSRVRAGLSGEASSTRAAFCEGSDKVSEFCDLLLELANITVAGLSLDSRDRRRGNLYDLVSHVGESLQCQCGSTRGQDHPYVGR